jgi:hypothetical protein
MFEFRARILQAGPNSFLGVIDGFPQILTESPTVGGAEIDVLNSLGDYIASLAEPPQAETEHDDFPTIAILRLRLTRGGESAFQQADARPGAG